MVSEEGQIDMDIIFACYSCRKVTEVRSVNICHVVIRCTNPLCCKTNRISSIVGRMYGVRAEQEAAKIIAALELLNPNAVTTALRIAEAERRMQQLIDAKGDIWDIAEIQNFKPPKRVAIVGSKITGALVAAAMLMGVGVGDSISLRERHDFLSIPLPFAAPFTAK